MIGWYEPKCSEAYTIKQMIEKYGPGATLSSIFTAIKGNRTHECPKCSGRGYVKVEYNGYPSGLPDSGWVYEAAFKDVKCDVCDGFGYTVHKMVPNVNVVQNGWKEEEE